LYDVAGGNLVFICILDNIIDSYALPSDLVGSRVGSRLVRNENSIIVSSDLAYYLRFLVPVVGNKECFSD